MGTQLGELFRIGLGSAADVDAVGQLARDLAREAGAATLEQTKLATVVSGLARRCLASAREGEVIFSVEGDEGGRRLVVTVADPGPHLERAAVLGADEADSPPASADRAALGLEMHSLRRLVDYFEQAAGHDGSTRVSAAVQLSAEVGNDPDLVPRLAALKPSSPPATPAPADLQNGDVAGMLEAQAKVLELTISELGRSNTERIAVIAELALTNRGVLDLVAELSTANDSLTASGTEYRRLADQQSALADLGHRAVASRDIRLLTLGLVGILRKVLDVQVVGVLRFAVDSSTLEVVATDGCGPELPVKIKMGRRRARTLQKKGTVVAEVTDAKHDFPLPLPSDSRSFAVVAIHTPAGPWGVLVACDTAPDRFTSTTTSFLEAAASLLAFSIARMASEGAAQHASLHDELTGLPNRAQLLQHMDRSVDRGRHPVGSGLVEPQKAVIFIDIDGFKQVNDTAGHAAGDQVLIEAGARLRGVMRPTDILARLGGDEFVAVCEDAAGVAGVVAKRLLSAFDNPFIVEGREVFLSASAGVALVEAGVTADQVLADADIAMYKAKLTAGSATVIFLPEMRAMADSESHLHNQLRRALERGELRAVYQPVVDLDTGTVRSVETLLRWRHPELGDVSAQRTIAAAERIGLAWELTCWIAGEAAQTISAWNAANPEHAPLRVAVNFTPLLLGDPVRIGEFEGVVSAAGLPFALLDVELTETAFADPTPSTLASMAELRHRGARLSMDDFGTGYSSLKAVATLPLDVLKIDQSFVAPLENGDDSLLVSAMTGIARGRGLETVGEGVETHKQLAALIAAECDLGQGYLFARPLERDQLQTLAGLESGFTDIIRQARRPVPAEPITQHSSVPAHGQPARILVLEENPDDMELLERILQASRDEITAVADPVAFVTALQDCPPDLVLMALRLRGSSGFDLVEKSEALLTMPVLAITGLPDWAIRHDPRSRHFAAIIHKPVDPGRLLTQIQDLLADQPSSSVVGSAGIAAAE